MKHYLVDATGYIWTIDELKEVYEQQKDDLEASTFEEYLDRMEFAGEWIDLDNYDDEELTDMWERVGHIQDYKSLEELKKAMESMDKQ